MTSQTLIIVAIVVVLLVAALAAWMYMQQQRRARLRQRFGPEYERTVREVGTVGRAETMLEERQQRVEQLRIRPLSREQAESFAADWDRVQARFVDDPAGAVDAADTLVSQVMAARGYPLENFEQRAADLSVDHPRVVEHYRAARDIALHRGRDEAGTEELRQAVVHYRALFEDLLEGREAEHKRRAS